MSEDFLVERRGAVSVFTLNRPDARNALNDNLLRGIGGAILAAEEDPEVRALVLIGAGDKAFCAGMDLRAFAAGEAIGSGKDPATQAYHRLCFGGTKIPVVGAANGSAMGGGLEILLGCDLIVAADHAQFGLPEVKRGLFPAGGGTNIGQRIPLALAYEMTMTGEPISAARGYEIGLFNAVVPAAELLDTAVGYAAKIAAAGPLGVRACKELVRLGLTDAAAAAEKAPHWRTTVFTSADAQEGATAFMERREPVWHGK